MITGLGYAGFGSSALEDWRQFGTNLVGFQAVERGNSLLAFRMDDRKQRVVIDRTMGDGARFFGWEVADAAALDALAASLEAAKVEVTAEPKTLADARRVSGLISFHDPAGNRLEAFYGAEVDETHVECGANLSEISVDNRKVGREARPVARELTGLVGREESLGGVKDPFVRLKHRKVRIRQTRLVG